MRTTGRPAAALLAALLLSGCGSAGRQPESAPAPTASSAGPERCAAQAPEPPIPSYDAESGFAADTPGDMPPHYAENHAFQRRLQLCDEYLERATAEAARARRALVARAASDVDEVRKVFAELGYDPALQTVTSAGEGSTFVVEVAAPADDQPATCLEGSVGPDGAVVTAHGVYLEGTGCLEPQPGH